MLTRVRAVVVWVILLGALSLVTVGVLVPRLGGATPYTVLTGSMSPKLPPGTLVVVKPVAVEELGVGDVITYQLESGRATVVTHRIVAQRLALDGTRSFVTQGDANSSPDSELVQPVQVRGRLWYSVPKVGYLNSWVSPGARQWAIWGIGAALASYAGFMFVSAGVDRRRKRAEQEQS